MGYPYEDRRLKAMAKLCCGCQGCWGPPSCHILYGCSHSHNETMPDLLHPASLWGLLGTGLPCSQHLSNPWPVVYISWVYKLVWGITHTLDWRSCSSFSAAKTPCNSRCHLPVFCRAYTWIVSADWTEHPTSAYDVLNSSCVLTEKPPKCCQA
jgi:hypothetical protein